MKEKNSKYFGKYEVSDNFEKDTKQKLKKYYDEFKIILANKEKTKQLANSIKKLLSKQ